MALAEAARDAAARLLASRAPTIHILAQQDADGIAAAGILARALLRAQRSFRLRFQRPYEPHEDIEAEENPQVILGINPAVTPWPAEWAPFLAIWDEPAPKRAAEPYDLNPRSLGEGVRSASTASSALAVAIAIDAANWDQAALALAGAWSQDLLTPMATGWNDAVLKHAQRDGLISVETALRLPDGPLADSLAAGVPGLGSFGLRSLAAARAFLEGLGLPPDATPTELGTRDQQTLASALLYAHLREGGAPAAHAVRLFAPMLAVAAPFDMPLAQLARILQSAAEDHSASEALAWALGDASVRADLDASVTRATAEIEKAMRELAPDGGEGPLVHAISRIDVLDTLTRTLSRSGPGRIVALYTQFRGRTVACLRLPDTVVAKGVDASQLLDRCVAPLGGSAGGHAHHAIGHVPVTEHRALAERLQAELGAIAPEVVS